MTFGSEYCTVVWVCRIEKVHLFDRHLLVDRFDLASLDQSPEFGYWDPLVTVGTATTAATPASASTSTVTAATATATAETATSSGCFVCHSVD